MTVCQSSTRISPTGAKAPTPALLTSTSMPPNAAAASAMNDSTAA